MSTSPYVDAITKIDTLERVQQTMLHEPEKFRVIDDNFFILLCLPIELTDGLDYFRKREKERTKSIEPPTVSREYRST